MKVNEKRLEELYRNIDWHFKAWLEGKKEMETNENLMLKVDIHVHKNMIEDYVYVLERLGLLPVNVYMIDILECIESYG